MSEKKKQEKLRERALFLREREKRKKKEGIFDEKEHSTDDELR
jgi:hypothetical protein